jgi:hypothetical protein
MPVLHVSSAAEFDQLLKGDKGVRYHGVDVVHT